MQPAERFERVLAAIDSANARDPNIIEFDGGRVGAEFVYGRRMTETLAEMAPEASECLRIAARGQHIERWAVPRHRYPAGRAGYLQWRRVQRRFQAERLGELMSLCGYGEDEIARVGVLIRKENMNSDAEVQMLEDVICVMFLKYYLKGLPPKADTDKLADILAKTWKRMSEHGHRHALKLDLSPRIRELLQCGLARLDRAPG